MLQAPPIKMDKGAVSFIINAKTMTNFLPFILHLFTIYLKNRNILKERNFKSKNIPCVFSD